MRGGGSFSGVSVWIGAKSPFFAGIGPILM
jgi:hypothetical protein